MVCGLYAAVCGGYWRPPGPNFAVDPGVPWDQEFAQIPKPQPTWPGPIDGVQDHQDPGLPKVAGEALGDEFSPKGVSILTLKALRGESFVLWPPFP
ncbi:hypothetical protein O181_117345 [Austropuccinia psidii MF-1]|uniref:Uncharacterized protein n=1 Tax=Austropuccinia psidii MF-1 TaxID=1389203 RepID=A0A9Q3KE75_9BASI|nr:hypothetical protein [Austropuccinia psidii MF-1]